MLLAPFVLEDTEGPEALRKDGIRALAMVCGICRSGRELHSVLLAVDSVERSCGVECHGSSNPSFSTRGASSSLPAAVSSSESNEYRNSMVKEEP